MHSTRPLLVLLIVVVSLLTRGVALGHATLPHAPMQEHAAITATTDGCHDSMPDGGHEQTANDERSCRIACDLGSMPPLATFPKLDAPGYSPVRIARLHTLTLADALPPDLPPPRS